MKRSQLQLQLNYSTQNCAINYLQLTHKKHWIAIKKHWNTRWNKKNTRFSGKTLRVVPLHCSPHCTTTLGTTVGYLLHKRTHCCLVRSIPNCQCRKLSQSWWAPYCNRPPNWCQNKAENAAAAKLLMSWGSTAFPVLKMQVASQGI